MYICIYIYIWQHHDSWVWVISSSSVKWKCLWEDKPAKMIFFLKTNFKTFVCKSIPLKRGVAIFSHVGENVQNVKDFLKRFARIPIFICKSSLVEIKDIPIGFVWSDSGALMWNAFFIFFCTTALPTTNDFWGNQESLDPLGSGCACIG